MLIEIEKPATYPNAMQTMIYQYIKENLVCVEEQIRKKTLEYDCDVLCAIEDYLLYTKAESLYNQLFEIMNDKEIVCYHATKVLDRRQLIENGLRVNDWNGYSELMRKVLLTLGDPNVDKAIEYIHDEYDRKLNSNNNVMPNICFFSGLNLLNFDNIAGFDQFCQNMGGELARWALKENLPETYQLLKNNGIQLVVKFRLPFRDIAYFRQEIILYQFVSYYAAKYFWEWNYSVKFDGITFKNVSPQQILELIDYRKKIDYD